MKWVHKWIMSILLFSIVFVTQGNAWWGSGSNDPQVDINATASVTEGDSGTTSLQLTITVSDCPDTKDIIIHWETAENSSATSDIDYQQLDGNVTFDAPSLHGTSCTPVLRTKNITVYIKGDVAPESNETFLVNLSDGGTDSSQDFHFGQDHTTITILNDDTVATNVPPIMGDISTQYADVNNSYSFDINPYITTTDGDAVLSYALSGTLPDGLSFDTSTGIISGTPTATGRWTVSVTATDKDGESNADSFDIVVRSSSGETHSTANDLCYDWIDYAAEPSGFPPIGFCINFGFIKGGINCKQTISIRNQGDDRLTDVDVIIDTTGFSGSFLADCGVDGTSGNCNQNNMFDMGPMGIFGQSIVYDPMPNYDANDSHTIYDKALLSMAIFSGQNLYGHYTKNGEEYTGEIHPCGQGIKDYQVGRIDGWDTFRDSSTPPSDINLSTKIVNKPFKISVGTFDEERTKYEVLPGTGAIEYGIYEDGTTTLISNETDSISASTTSHESESNQFTVTTATKTARVGFKLCLTYERDTSTGHWIYELHPAGDCTGSAVACNVRTRNNTPEWHICYSTDKFAVRPKKFAFVEPSTFEPDEDMKLLRAGKDYNFTVQATDDLNNSAIGYDQIKANLDINTTLVDQTGAENNNLEGNILFSTNNFHFEDGNSTDASGNHEVVGLSFDNVGNIIINLIDKEWASIDSDDTPLDCNGGTVGSVNVPYGSYICGEENATFIPDHFSLIDVNVTNKQKDANFTYVSNDLNMSAHVELTIKAMNANNQITTNFKENNTTYYENPIEINITVPTNITFPDNTDKNLTHIEHNVSKALLGFGGDDANGTHTIRWNESNQTQQLLFNYKRKNNTPINPFEVNGTDINVTVTSEYTGVTDEVTGVTKKALIKDWNSTKLKATFHYARAKATKDFYDDVTGNSIKTPIKVEVYCNKWPASAALCPQVDAINGQTSDYRWFLSTAHDQTKNDGNITLTADNGGSVTPPDVNITSGGINNNVTVSIPSSTTRPVTTNITFATGTNSWLIYNPKSPISDPDPFYKVRFIGTADWAGYGKTGHVLDTNASIKKNRRLNW